MRSRPGAPLHTWLAILACLLVSAVPAKGLVVCVTPDGGLEFGLGRECPQAVALDAAAAATGAAAAEDVRIPSCAVRSGLPLDDCVDALADGQRDGGSRRGSGIEGEEDREGSPTTGGTPGGATLLAGSTLPVEPRAGPPDGAGAARDDGPGCPRLHRHLMARRSVVLQV